MAITVQGEHYDSALDLYKTIVDLESGLQDWSQDTPTYKDMLSHIERLRDALPDDFDPTNVPDESASTKNEVSADADPADEVPEEEDADEPEVEGEDLVPVCPLCGSVGLLPEQPPQDPTAQQCPACNGIGIVFTGSRVEGHETRNCPQCLGNGFVATEPAIPLPPPPIQANAAPALEGAQWNPSTHRWMPPADASEPWAGATWNGLTGGYE